MADDVDRDDSDDPASGETPPAKPKRRRRSSAAAPPARTGRLDRRASKVEFTVREATKWRLGDRAGTDLGFVETVDRDAGRIGYAVAAIGERVKPFGQLIDLMFGEGGPLSILVALTPSIRAGRAAVLARAAERRRRRAEQAEAAIDPEDPSTWPPGYRPPGYLEDLEPTGDGPIVERGPVD